MPASSIRPPTPAELARLLRAAASRDPELATFVVLSAATGARRSEPLALRWEHVNLDRSVLTVARGIVLGPGGLVEKDTKTHQVRRVTLDQHTRESPPSHRELARERAAICGLELDRHGFVFTTELGSSPWFPDSVSRRFRMLGRDVGLPGVRLNDRRHYVATRLLAAGVDVRTVAGRLGHRNASTTLNVSGSKPGQYPLM